MIRNKIDYIPKDQVTLHYFALHVSSVARAVWDLREDLPYRKRFFISEKTRSIIVYDRIINNESPLQ